MNHTATYSPDDNKLRIHPACRLSAEEYARVKASGFKWAPKLQQFIAPMWTPGREDLAIDLCGEIGDEDTTLEQRANDRAERFEEYSDKRMQDANRAADSVKQLADGIPLGQPILIGHHSERRARKDAQRIENGMRKAVRMWETSEYWTRRAAAAVRHAQYKERPDVRARRIAKLEAEQRKMQRGHDDTERKRALWEKAATRDQVLEVANHCHLSMCFPLDKYPRQPPASQYEGQMSFWSAITDGVITWEQARELALKLYADGGRRAEHYRRWKEHYENRLAYERAMLGEQGGLLTDQKKPERGGAVLRWGKWHEIHKVNPKSVTIMDSYSPGGRVFPFKVPFDKVQEIKTRAEWLEFQGKPADTPAPAKPTLPPLCNYRAPGCKEMTEHEWKVRTMASDFAHVRTFAATDEHETHRARTDTRGGGGANTYDRLVVFLTDKPEKLPPKRERVPLPAMPEAVEA